MSSDKEEEASNSGDVVVVVVREEEEDDIGKSIAELECPFTWQMDEIDSSIFIDYKPHDEEDSILLMKLARALMAVYVESKENGDEKKINQELDRCHEIMKALRTEKSLEFSIEAVQHVLDATACHVLVKLGEPERARELLAKTKKTESMSNFDKSTISGCRGLGWSLYHELGSEKAIGFARQALEKGEECAIWHFVLGKNLRRVRRDVSCASLPGDEESRAFLKAYEKSKSHVYGIFVAQMYREARQEAKALAIYEQILRARPESSSVYLRLALGFIQLFKLPQAKACLDAVAVACRDDSVYQHYMGKYLVKVKQYKQAICYLEKAAKTDNYPAVRDLVRCRRRINRFYNATDYLLSLAENKALGEKNQSLMLDLAFSYLNDENIDRAVEYFARAVAIDPSSKSLVEYYSFYNPGKSDNVYNIIANRIIPRKNSLDEGSMKSYEELKKYYQKYIDNQTDFMESRFRRVRT